MTEWRDWPAWRRVTSVSMDAVSSAAIVGRDAAFAVEELVRRVAEYAPDSFEEAVSDALRLLVRRQAVRAPVLTLCNEVYLALGNGPGAVLEIVTELADRWDVSTRRIGEVGAPLIGQDVTVLVHGASTSVRSVLDAAREKASFQVCCTEALPGGEGIEMAAELTEAGFDVELIGDASAVEFVPGVDVVMAGADAVGPKALVTKAGIGRLASAARSFDIPVYLTAGEGKILPDELFRVTRELRGRAGLSEVVPLEWFTAVVSDLGILDEERIVSLAAERPVAPQLLT